MVSKSPQISKKTIFFGVLVELFKKFSQTQSPSLTFTHTHTHSHTCARRYEHMHIGMNTHTNVHNLSNKPTNVSLLICNALFFLFSHDKHSSDCFLSKHPMLQIRQFTTEGNTHEAKHFKVFLPSIHMFRRKKVNNWTLALSTK